jgi:acyl-CoA reductase-like NAD-dependent aldehyde dehydrogenase
MTHDLTEILKSTQAQMGTAAQAWRTVSLADRLRIIRQARKMIAVEAMALAESVGPRRTVSETLVSEVLPLAEAARFLERQALRLLAPRRLGRRGRPVWLIGVKVEIWREPVGTVLVIAPANYPLFLPGVQVLQALAAGNAVCVKPAADCSAPVITLVALLRRAGLPEGLVSILPDTIEAGQKAVTAGFDRIILTGSASTGVAVLRGAADQLTPCTMELSGDDPVFVLPDADLALAGAAIAYGTRLNAGHTCIAPRRVFALPGAEVTLARLLAAQCRSPPPIIVVRDMEEALSRVATSPYALGVAIFGPDKQARKLAARVDAGCVVVNDVIVPTADPRLPFGGRRRSGFGVTRGAEGLLEMTVLKSVAVRRGRFRPHLARPQENDGQFFSALIAALHGNNAARLAAVPRLCWRLLKMN